MKYPSAISGADTTISASLVAGKYLLARKPFTMYYGYPLSKTTEEKPAGQIVFVYSWVVRGAQLWWQCEFSDGGYFYVKQEKGLWDWDYLRAQFKEGEIPPPDKIEIPLWLGLAVTGFGLYQASQPQFKKHKLLIQAGSIGIGAWTASQALSKVDFNPFD